MLKSDRFRSKILTSRIARNVGSGTVAHREKDRGLGGLVCNLLPVNHLTRHAASLHANGVPFDLRKVYVSGCES